MDVFTCTFGPACQGICYLLLQVTIFHHPVLLVLQKEVYFCGYEYKFCEAAKL